MFTYIKLGYLEFVRNLKINLLIVIEIAAVLITAIFTVSSVRSQLRFYEPLSNYLNSKSLYIIPETLSNRVSYDKQLTSYEAIFEKIPEAERVCAQTYFSFNFTGGSMNVSIRGMGYPEEIVEGFKPLLEDGKWLSEVSQEDGVVNAVVTENYSNLEVGDELTAETESGEPITVRIVGKIKNSAAIFKKPSGDMSSYKADDFFPNYLINSDTQNEPYIIVAQEDIDRCGYYYYIDKCALIKLDDSTSDERVEEILSLAMSVGSGMNAESIGENTMDEVKTNLIFLLPIVVGVLLFTIVTTICMSAINAKKQLRSYGVYYICGSRWKQCVFISVFSSIVTAAIAAVLAALALFIGDKAGMLKNTVIEFGSWQLLACLAVVALYLKTAIIMPLAIIGRTNPREILKNNE